MCEKDIILFFNVYLGLLEYANKKLRVTNLKKNLSQRKSTN